MKAPKVKAFLVKVARHDHWALPDDAESYERMVEQVYSALKPYVSLDDAKRALRAIGIVPPRTGKGRK